MKKHLLALALALASCLSAHAGCREDLMASNMERLDPTLQATLTRLMQSSHSATLITATEAQGLLWSMNMARFVTPEGFNFNGRARLQAPHEPGPGEQALQRRLKNTSSSGLTLVPSEIALILERILYTTNGSLLAMDPTPAPAVVASPIITIAAAAPLPAPEADPTLYVMPHVINNPVIDISVMGGEVPLFQYYNRNVRSLEQAIALRRSVAAGRMEIGSNYGTALASLAVGFPLQALPIYQYAVLNTLINARRSVTYDNNQLNDLQNAITAIRDFHERHVQNLADTWENDLNTRGDGIFYMTYRDYKHLVRARLSQSQVNALSSEVDAMVRRLCSFSVRGHNSDRIAIIRIDLRLLVNHIRATGR